MGSKSKRIAVASLGVGALTGALLLPMGPVVAAPVCTISGTSADDTLTGTSGDDVICGGDGQDVIDGLGGNDVIYGGAGFDVVIGGVGNDTIYGDGEDDELFGGDGDDILYGSFGLDRLDGGAGADQLYGEADNDELAGGDGADTLRGGFGTDTLFGDAGADTLLGEADNDFASGGDGDDTVYGGFGTDRLTGDAGADVLLGENDSDELFGGTGVDRLVGGFGNDALDGGPQADTLDGSEDGDNCVAEAAGSALTSCEDIRTNSNADIAADYVNSAAGALEPVQRLNDAGATLSASTEGVTVNVPKLASGIVALETPGAPQDRVTIDLPDSGSSTSASLARDGSASFDTNATTNITVQATGGGARISTVLASATAPARYDYAIGVPNGGSMALVDGGAVVIKDANDAEVAAVAPAWARDARGANVPTRYEVNGTTLTQVVDLSSSSIVFPVVADPYLGRTIISSVTRVNTSSGVSYRVVPTGWGRAFNDYIHARYGWPEAVSKGVPARQGLYEQYVCHPLSGLARVKSSWNLDTWRPTVGLARTVAKLCNP